MLVTHWGLSGPVILRLSAWGARDLFSSGYKGKEISPIFSFPWLSYYFTSKYEFRHFLTWWCLDAGIVMVDFMPDLHIEDVKSILSRHKHQFAVCLKLVASFVNFYDFFFFFRERVKILIFCREICLKWVCWKKTNNSRYTQLCVWLSKHEVDFLTWNLHNTTTYIALYKTKYFKLAKYMLS